MDKMFTFTVCRMQMFDTVCVSAVCGRCCVVVFCTGLKYASENENDLKDKMDFVVDELRRFPPGGKLYCFVAHLLFLH